MRVHMNGRVYEPKLGRMLSPDPVTQAPENGQNYNRYSYAMNNPLRYKDPSGFEWAEAVTVPIGQGQSAADNAIVTANQTLGAFSVLGQRVPVLNTGYTESYYSNGRELIGTSWWDDSRPGHLVVKERKLGPLGQQAIHGDQTENGFPSAEIQVTGIDIDGVGGAGPGFQIFGGLFGISGSVMVVNGLLNDTACIVTTGCFQVGLGVFGSISANVSVGVVTEALETGESESVGVFYSSGAGASSNGSIDIADDGSISGTKAGVGPGAGAAVGIQFCKIVYHCDGELR